MSFKIANIGCGWVSTACHGPACVEYAGLHPDTTLAACCDLNAERAEAFRARFGFQHAYANYIEMLEAEHPHAVCLNVPPEMISVVGCEIMRRGYPLLSEKPPGLNVAEIDRLIDAAQSSGVINQVAFNRRFMPLAVELKKRLTEQTVYHIEVQQARVARTDPVFATTAIHAIDAARFVAGCDYQELRLAYQEQPKLGPGVANYLLDGHFENGATVHLGIFPVTGINIERITIYTADNAFALAANNGPDAPGRLRCFFNGELVADLNGHAFTGRQEDYYLNGFYQEDAAFFDAVRSGSQPAHDFRSAHQPVEIMQCLIERRNSF